MRRLKEVDASGNFTIKCDTAAEFGFVQKFFHTSKDSVDFKDLMNGDNGENSGKAKGKAKNRFVIRYSNLNELLKLREIFQIRAGKFDMYLIKKRSFDPFIDFFKTYSDPCVRKVRK